MLLDRVSEFLLLGAIATMRGTPEAATEMLALARLACDVPDDIDDAPIFAAIVSLLDSYEEVAAVEPEQPPPARVPDPGRHGGPDAGGSGSGDQLRFRCQISRSPVSVSRSSTSSIVSRMNGTSTPASPPVAITRVDAPSSARRRPTMPSTWAANP